MHKTHLHAESLPRPDVAGRDTRVAEALREVNVNILSHADKTWAKICIGVIYIFRMSCIYMYTRVCTCTHAYLRTHAYMYTGGGSDI